jgi:multicomponent K+:H+ antiporter subunit G
MSSVGPWAEAVVGVLLIASGIASVIAAVGMLRLRDFFLRMHAPTLASTLGTWCVALASIVFLSLHDARLQLHAWIVVILLAVTAPVTTVLLARAALFRERQRRGAVPPPLRPHG